jgi:acetylornithine deacetylase
MSNAPCIRYLRDYVAIPSVNPMRRTDIGPEIAGEARYAEHLREQLRRLGLDAELVGPSKRPSVLAEVQAAGARETVLVASHLDTVPVDGMEIDPFDPRLEGGRVYGRGACDTKGGMAALVEALERVLPRGTLRCNLLVVGEADEELSSIGAHSVLQHLSDRRPDWVLATEPTDLRVATRHRGVAHARLKARGTAGHASNPSAGSNAIVALARAVLALEELASQLARREDPELGVSTLSVGLVGGGSAANIIPSEAWLMLDRRLLPGEDEASVRAELEGMLLEHEISDVSVDWCKLEKGPLSTPDDHAAVRRCQQALATAGLPTAPEASAFGTDAGVFALHGIPGVVLGPGSIEQAHSACEWVEVQQVERMADLLVRLLEGR